MKTVIALVALLPVVGCAGQQLPFPIDENGYFDTPKQEDVCAARRGLAEYEPGTPMPRQSRGIVLIQGVILGARLVPELKQELSVRVDKTLLNDGAATPEHLAIVTPAEKFGGVPVYIGESYRFALLPLDGKFYSWATMGSAPIDNALSGFYRCPSVSRKG
jgi:hypothetical protein